jgi:hypothetical protein
MQFVIGVFTHTPIWVFALFAYLVWQGINAMRPRTQPIWRLLIVPSIFIIWGLSRIGFRQDAGMGPLLAWLIGALLLAPLAFFTGPKLLAIDRSKGLVTRAGGPMPLIRNVTVFALQYTVAVMTALHLDSHSAGAIAGRAVSGATAGYFIGWAVALLRRYRDAGETALGKLGVPPSVDRIEPR